MKVTHDNDTITLTIEKKEYPHIFDKYQAMKDLETYFDYVLDLDAILNGDDGTLCGYPNIESFKESLAKMSSEDIAKEKKESFNLLVDYVDILYKAIPPQYFYSMEEYDLVFIPDNCIIEWLKYNADKLRLLLEHNDKEGK